VHLVIGLVTGSAMLNESLKVLRTYLGKTQAELANDLGLSQSYLSEIESGDKDVTLEVLRKYGSHLDIPLSSLLFFAENIEGVPTRSKRQIFVADKVLKLLKRIAPPDVESQKE
jgi:transcriptional regulator with XRE-family HTH domain